jgi:hypothetical protein
MATSRSGARSIERLARRPPKIPSGQTYSVTVKAQPTNPWQSCTVTGGTGTVGASNVTSVAVNCTTHTYTIGGTVSGLSGTGLVLQNKGGDDLTISGSGSFAFATPISSGGSYNVTVKTNPTNPWQTCAVTNAAGTVAGSNVTSVQVSCTTNTYNVKVNVSGRAGSGLVLRTFTFATPVASGAAYNVTVLTQPAGPWQTCTVASPTGTMGGADVTLAVTCVTNTYSIGGTVSGLSGSGLVLRNNGGDNLSISASGTFTFATKIASGATYAVTILTHPSGQYCSVTNASGTVDGANVTNVTVSCTNGMGTVVDVTGASSSVWYVPCGSGSASACTQAAAESSCTAIGKKLVSHASNGTSSIVSLGATISCNFSISYFTNYASSVAGQCLVGVSNASWSSCCGTSSWHGNTVNIPSTLGQQFGYVTSGNSGYNASMSNVSGTMWGCQSVSSPASSLSGCGVYYVACK